MKLTFFTKNNIISNFSTKEILATLGILFLGLILTAISVYYMRINMRRSAIQEFQFTCNAVRIKIESRLEQHAQLLRSGAALFAVTDTMTREDWSKFTEITRVSRYLPGIEGFGYSVIVQPDQLSQHIKMVRESGFPYYNIRPDGVRDIYTSIIYLEPFTGRNMLAFGYDMFSEPVRRKAMEIARDSNYAMLSGIVTLVQETDETNVQPGILMYVPVYKNDMPINTLGERRLAVQGWVYSPYRMKDLISGIQRGSEYIEDSKLNYKIYDEDVISEETLLFDSQITSLAAYYEKPNLFYELPVQFNGKKWSLQFNTKRNELNFFHSDLMIVLLSGFIISLLLFFLTLLQIRSTIRSREIRMLNTQLEKLNYDKDRFITILSHDLKSPFTSILGFLEILTEDIRRFDIDTIENYVGIINSSAKHTYNLLEDLLMWARAHAGKIIFRPQNFSISDMYENVVEVLRPSAESKDINIKFYSEDVVTVYADMDMLKAILRNLISNSIKFTNRGGSVSVTTEKHPTHVTIAVIDTGVGIKQEVIKRLFDISKVMTTAGTENERGSGLGLILCKEFVEKHGGKLWVESEPGKGSTFRFTLPFEGTQSQQD